MDFPIFLYYLTKVELVRKQLILLNVDCTITEKNKYYYYYYYYYYYHSGSDVKLELFFVNFTSTSAVFWVLSELDTTITTAVGSTPESGTCPGGWETYGTSCYLFEPDLQLVSFCFLFRDSCVTLNLSVTISNAGSGPS